MNKSKANRLYFIIVCVLATCGLVVAIFHKIKCNRRESEVYRENFEQNKFQAPVPTTSSEIVVSDSSGNLTTSTLDTITSKGLNIGKWGIYQDTNKQLCFIRNDIDSAQPFCFNGDHTAEGGGIMSGAKNSVRAWVTFKASSFADKPGTYVAANKSLTSKASGSEKGWDDAFNITSVERSGVVAADRPDTYKITFKNPMPNDSYVVLLGQGDPTGVKDYSYVNVTGIKEKSKNYFTIFIRSDGGGKGTAVRASWYGSEGDTLISAMVLQ